MAAREGERLCECLYARERSGEKQYVPPGFVWVEGESGSVGGCVPVACVTGRVWGGVRGRVAGRVCGRIEDVRRRGSV